MSDPNEYTRQRRNSGWELKKNSAILALDARLAAVADQPRPSISTTAAQTNTLDESGRRYDISLGGRIPGLQEGMTRALGMRNTRQDPELALREKENVIRESTTRMPYFYAGATTSENPGEGLSPQDVKVGASDFG
jgi:hypothetical protein